MSSRTRSARRARWGSCGAWSDVETATVVAIAFASWLALEALLIAVLRAVLLYVYREQEALEGRQQPSACDACGEVRSGRRWSGGYLCFKCSPLPGPRTVAERPQDVTPITIPRTEARVCPECAEHFVSHVAIAEARCLACVRKAFEANAKRDRDSQHDWLNGGKGAA